MFKFAMIILVATTVAIAQDMPADYAAVLKSLGKQGDYKAKVLKINIPRNDLKVTIDGIPIPTPWNCRRPRQESQTSVGSHRCWIAEAH